MRGYASPNPALVSCFLPVVKGPEPNSDCGALLLSRADRSYTAPLGGLRAAISAPRRARGGVSRHFFHNNSVGRLAYLSVPTALLGGVPGVETGGRKFAVGYIQVGDTVYMLLSNPLLRHSHKFLKPFVSRMHHRRWYY